jgi:hypothetical protein
VKQSGKRLVLFLSCNEVHALDVLHFDLQISTYADVRHISSFLGFGFVVRRHIFMVDVNASTFLQHLSLSFLKTERLGTSAPSGFTPLFISISHLRGNSTDVSLRWLPLRFL